jgi:hypothetical protein
MTPQMLEQIPSTLIFERNTEQLRAWLYARGATLTLAELDAERNKRRGTKPRPRPATATRGGTDEGNDKS